MGRDDDYSIGRRIKEYREKYGMTQAVLAELAGYSIPYISLIENGHRHATPDTLIKIMNALEISSGELFAEQVEKDKEIISAEVEALLKDCTMLERRYLLRVLQVHKKELMNYKQELLDSELY